jgi:signal transduction histidine kinase
MPPRLSLGRRCDVGALANLRAYFDVSLKRRLIAVVICAELLLAAGGVAAAIIFSRQQLIGAFHTIVRARALTVAALVRYTEGTNELYFDSSLAPAETRGLHPDLYEIRSSDGKLVVHSPGWNSVPGPRPGRTFWRFHSAGAPYGAVLITDLPVLDREEGVTTPPTLTIRYASPMTEIEARVRDAAIYVALAGLILLVASVALARWGIGRGLASLEDMAQTAERISSNRSQVAWPARARQTLELTPLVQALDHMLARLRKAAEQQQQFIADAAHELKTPVATLKASLQYVLQRPREAGVYRTTAEGALDDVQRLEALVQRMLRLACAERLPSERTAQAAVIDVNDTCEAALAHVQALATAKQVNLRFRRDGPMPVRADTEDLELVWTNLLDNAVKYSPPGGDVNVRISSAENQITIAVEDRGPGIPATDLPRIFQRFYRGDPSRTRQSGGFGLGLSIAKAIVEAYGGNMEARSAVGAGTAIVVRLPAASDGSNSR